MPDNALKLYRKFPEHLENLTGFIIYPCEDGKYMVLHTKHLIQALNIPDLSQISTLHISNINFKKYFQCLATENYPYSFLYDNLTAFVLTRMHLLELGFNLSSQ